MYIGKRIKKKRKITKIVEIVILILLFLLALFISLTYLQRDKIVKTLVPVSQSVEPYENGNGQVSVIDPADINAGNILISNISFTNENSSLNISFDVTNNQSDAMNFEYFLLNLYNSNNLCIGKSMIPTDIIIPKDSTITVNGGITNNDLASKCSLLEINKIEFCRYYHETENVELSDHYYISAKNVDEDTIDDVSTPFSYTIANMFSVAEVKNGVNVKSEYEYYMIQIDGDKVIYKERNYGLSDMYGGYIAFNLYNEDREYIGKVYDDALEGITLVAQTTEDAEVEITSKHFVEGFSVDDIAYVKLALLYSE